MKFLACLQLLSVVGSIDAAGIADDNKGRVSSVRELQAPEEPPQPTPAQLCGGKSSANNVLFLLRVRDTP